MEELKNAGGGLAGLLAGIEKARKNAPRREAILQQREAKAVELPVTAPAPAAPAKAGQLPLWPDEVRGVPNSVLRSALFGAIKRGRRAFLQREPIASYDGVMILQTGPRLDQADLDVWEQCMHLARSGGLGCRIQFSAHAFLKGIRRSTGKSQHEWLKDAFARLASTVVEIKDGKRAYFGPLIHHGTRDDESGLYVIEINPAIVSLYGSDGWTAIEVEQRYALRRQQLALWLHGHYATHAAPYPMKVSSLHRLSGSEAKELYGYRRELREALERLSDVTGWGWQIDDADLVHIDKKGGRSAAQTRHLLKKGTA